jgi:hypothetical protein
MAESLNGVLIVVQRRKKEKSFRFVYEIGFDGI